MATPSTPHPPTTQQNDPAVPRIMVVDDDREGARYLVRLLVAARFEASLHHCGQEALDAIPATWPALVILDVDMPSMDGLECLRSICARHGADMLPIVMYSGDFAYERVSEAKRLGAQEYIVKGAMQWPEFLKVIQRHVAARGPDAEPGTEQAAV